MVKLGQNPPKKVAKRIGISPKKIGRSGGFVTPTRKIGVIPVKPVTVRNPGIRGGDVSFTLPSFGGNGGGAYPTNPNQYVLGDSATVAQAAANLHKDNPGSDILNPFKSIAALGENLNNPETWLTVVGYVIAIFLIIVSAYGIVTNTQKSVLSSALGQNTSGLINTFKPKIKPKGKK